jgi:voltage-gated potassium channel
VSPRAGPPFTTPRQGRGVSGGGSCVSRLARAAGLAWGVFSLAGLRYAALLAILTAIAGGEAFAEIEGVSVDDGLYWAATTMTTVGYGDFTPETDTGRAIAVAVVLVGIGFVAVLTGAIAQGFIAPAEERIEGTEAGLDRKVDDVIERLARIEAALGEPPGPGAR